MQIYLAGPLGFSEAGRAFHNDVLIPLLERGGHTVLDPWTLSDLGQIERVASMPYGQAKKDAWAALNKIIGANNAAAIDRADLVVAVLDGTDVDSGTAAEIGYAFAKGKRIVGYRGDFRLAADNEGSIVNLQVEYFIRKSGGTIVTKIEELTAAIGRPQAAEQ
jgi:nucleoside 2-deoxyribosyltransferase